MASEPLTQLLGAMRSLDATGAGGFEGLLRDLLTEFTGQQFRILKSGTQGGIDVLQDSDGGNGLVIAVEGKRYGEDTTLPLDQLKSKLVDASYSYPGLDLWLLATTREISAGDANALKDLGVSLGLAVEVLDWPSGPVSLPSLAVLCASASAVTRAHLGSETDDCLDSIQRHDRFDVERDRLRQRLQQPDIGYQAARTTLSAWLRRSFDDVATARANLDTYAHLLEPNVKRIKRRSIVEALDRWWSDERDTPLVVLGDEGVGKTWAVLSWWLDHSGGDGSLPLTLVVPARRVNGQDIEETLSEVLARRTGLRTADFWKRRMRLWVRQPAASPRILLVIDGLNQNWSFQEWTGLLQPLFTGEWKGQIAVVLTCRPDHWTNRLKELCDFQPAPKSLPVGPFADAELDELLKLEGLQRKDFAPELIGLIRVPRLSRLAIERRRELEGSGDVTAERLVYEDWKHRLALHGAHLATSDVEFHGFVAELGRRFRDGLKSQTTDAISRREILDRLGRDSGASPENLATTISEIVDGRWLESTGHPHQFRLRKDLAAFALGLALVDALRSVSAVGLKDRLADFFDPLQGQDLSVDVLRAASTIADLDGQCSEEVRGELLESWIAQHNFRPRDFAAFWHRIGVNPDGFLRLAEQIWLDRRGGFHIDEVLTKAFANAHSWPHVAERLQRWLTQWLATYWPDPDQGAFLNYDPNTDRADANRKATAARRGEWDAIASRIEGQIPVRCIEEGDVSWFCHRAIGVLSFLPRHPFVPALIAWAISRSIMGRRRHFEEVAWLLRLNSLDPSETAPALLAEAERLLGFGHPMTTRAAGWLLEALGTPEAFARVPASDGSSAIRTWPTTVEVDATTNTVRWDHREALRWPRSEKVPLDATMGLRDPALDPTLILPSDDIDVLRRLADTTDATLIWRHSTGRTSEDSGLETASQALARWAPDSLGNLMRRVFMSAETRDWDGLYGLGLDLPQHVLLLDDDQLRSVIAAADKHFKDRSPEGAHDQYLWFQLFLARLWKRPASEQIDVIASVAGDVGVPSGGTCVFAAPTLDDFENLASRLRPDCPPTELVRWVRYLTVAPLDRLPEGYMPLVSLIRHENKRVRCLALQVIWHSGDRRLAASLEESGWRIHEGMDADERVYGSLALCKAATEVNVAELRTRIDPNILGHLMRQAKGGDGDLNAFAEFVRDELFPPPDDRKVRSIGPCFADNQAAVDRLVQSRGSDVMSWLEPCLKDASVLRMRLATCDSLVLRVTRALLRFQPEEGVRVWSAVLETQRHAIDDFALLPIGPEDNSTVLNLRDKMLDRARTDLDLVTIAGAAIEHGRQAWLHASIRRDLSAPSAGGIARAITMAGFLDTSPEADAIWSSELATAPASGWLTRVHSWAQKLYLRNRWAHHWLEAFLGEGDRDRAFGFHTLFLACADRRALAWAPRRVKDSRADLPREWLCHWNLRRADLDQFVKKKDDAFKKRLFGTDILEHTHAPWL